MDEESIHALPRDILYVLSSISKLSAFIYGVIHFDRVKGEVHSKTPKENKIRTPENQTADEKWQIIMESKDTVVKIVEDSPGIPLIVLHGTLVPISLLNDTIMRLHRGSRHCRNLPFISALYLFNMGRTSH